MSATADARPATGMATLPVARSSASPSVGRVARRRASSGDKQPATTETATSDDREHRDHGQRDRAPHGRCRRRSLTAPTACSAPRASTRRRRVMAAQDSAARVGSRLAAAAGLGVLRACESSARRRASFGAWPAQRAHIGHELPDLLVGMRPRNDGMPLGRPSHDRREDVLERAAVDPLLVHQRGPDAAAAVARGSRCS